MDRISGANFETIGGKRFFQDLDLGTNTPGTSLVAAWFNGIQESVLAPVERAGLTPSDGDNTQLLQALLALPGKNWTLFTSGGTFTVPSAVTRLCAAVWGAGGGGGGSAGGAALPVAAGGGGAGFATGVFNVTPGAGITITVGAGGSGGAGTGGSTGSVNGTGGGTSSVGSLCSATGGGGGSSSDAGLGASGGSAGDGVGGVITQPGMPGGIPVQNSLGWWQGEGGGAFLMGRGRGTFHYTATAVDGPPGYYPGQGGAGGVFGSAGGAGANGLVLVWW